MRGLGDRRWFGYVVEVLLRVCVRFKFIFGGFWIIIVVKVCWSGFEGGLLGAAWVLEESGVYV